MGGAGMRGSSEDLLVIRSRGYRGSLPYKKFSPVRPYLRGLTHNYNLSSYIHVSIATHVPPKYTYTYITGTCHTPVISIQFVYDYCVCVCVYVGLN